MLKPALLMLCALLLSMNAWAADYRVDMIITLNRDAPPDIAMTHGLAVQPPVSTGGIEISDLGALKRAGISLLPDQSFGLDEQWRKLRNSRFRPVMRLAYSVSERATATTIQVHDDLIYQVVPLSTGDSVLMPDAVVSQPYSRYRLDGKLLIQQSAGLRVSLDLDYTLPFSAAPADYPAASGNPVVLTAADLAILRLRAEKRVNLGQVHFFDHPLLGVLLRVSPVN